MIRDRARRLAPLAPLTFGVTLALVALGCAPAQAPSASAPLCAPHVVVLLRHAEKATPADPQDKDPELSPRGKERAARLATLLGKSAASRLIATQYKRTQQTLQPLAGRLGKTIEVRPSSLTTDLVRELREAAPGSTTVVATHANVLPSIVHDLGGGPLRDLGPDGTLADDDYARVLVLTVGCSAAASVVELSSD